MSVSVKVRRKDQLFRALRESVPGLAEELDAATVAAANEMVAKAKQFAPVDQGDLRDSIGWARGPQSNDGFRVLGKSTGGENSISVFAGDRKAFYAAFVEFGTKPSRKGQRVGARASDVRQNKELGRKAYRTHPGNAPQPFFFPAYRLLRRGMKSKLSRAMTRAMKKAGLKR